MRNTGLIGIGAVAFITLVIMIVFANRIFHTIDAGQSAIIFKTFGGGIDRESVLGPGFHVIAPWNRLVVYEIREQIAKEEGMECISSKGLPIYLDVSIRFKPIQDKLGYLHDNIGRDYKTIIVQDIVRSAVRKIVASYEAEEVYSSKKAELLSKLQEIVAQQLLDKFLKLESIQIRNIKLPDQIAQSIQEKLQAQEEAKKFQYKLIAEEKEAERKIIEAEGIKKFQQIVNEGLSTNYLRWKGIETTEKLAKSPNSKVIVIGGGSDGLPLILGNQ